MASSLQFMAQCNVGQRTHVSQYKHADQDFNPNTLDNNYNKM